MVCQRRNRIQSNPALEEKRHSDSIEVTLPKPGSESLQEIGKLMTSDRINLFNAVPKCGWKPPVRSPCVRKIVFRKNHTRTRFVCDGICCANRLDSVVPNRRPSLHCIARQDRNQAENYSRSQVHSAPTLALSFEWSNYLLSALRNLCPDTEMSSMS